ncbi:holin family protein [Thalassobacillus sp. CUG 92003]|uniref:phage holin family protein n=1 Tax=Thalassobacillus sp. CUG 92003 TaxID=2736641 RepID=UPI0015E79546|nr:phage holin family protein [Thalassobacillus sp. CUG 92003]
MEMIFNYGKVTTAGGSFIFSYLFGGWTAMLVALIAFVTFDYVSGVAAAAYQDKLNARVGFWGIPKKVMIFGLVAIAHIIDMVYLDVVGEPMAIGEFQLSIMAATILYYIVNESISIFENLGKLGVPIPKSLKKAIAIFDEDYDSNKNKGA